VKGSKQAQGFLEFPAQASGIFFKLEAMNNHAPISPAKIHLVLSTSVGTLLVFYTNGHCWQFRVLSAEGGVFGERRIFYTPEAAERAFSGMGRKRKLGRRVKFAIAFIESPA
jgi:hypothetical protein